MNTKQNPPAADRLAQTVTDAISEDDEQRARNAYHAFVDSIPAAKLLAHLDFMEFGWRCYKAATIRARESAPAQESFPKGWSITRVFKSGVEIIPPDGRGLSPKMTIWPAQFSSYDAQMLYALANDLVEAAASRDVT